MNLVKKYFFFEKLLKHKKSAMFNLTRWFCGLLLVAARGSRFCLPEEGGGGGGFNVTQNCSKNGGEPFESKRYTGQLPEIFYLNSTIAPESLLKNTTQRPITSSGLPLLAIDMCRLISSSAHHRFVFVHQSCQSTPHLAAIQLTHALCIPPTEPFFAKLKLTSICLPTLRSTNYSAQLTHL